MSSLCSDVRIARFSKNKNVLINSWKLLLSSTGMGEYEIVNFIETSKGGIGVLCKGYTYKKSHVRPKSIQWWVLNFISWCWCFYNFYYCFVSMKSCAQDETSVTHYDNPVLMKITGKLHNHPPEKPNFKIVSAAEIFRWSEYPISDNKWLP